LSKGYLVKSVHYRKTDNFNSRVIIMMVFEYKQKLLPKILVMLVLGFYPLAFRLEHLYFSIPYYLIIVLTQIIIYAYFSSKKIHITEQGIEQIVLWKILWRTVDWTKMVEFYEIRSGGNISGNPLESMTEPAIAIRWFVEKNIGFIIKIIVDFEAPLYFSLNAIKRSSEFYEIIRDKVRLVKR